MEEGLLNGSEELNSPMKQTGLPANLISAKDLAFSTRKLYHLIVSKVAFNQRDQWKTARFKARGLNS